MRYAPCPLAQMNVNHPNIARANNTVSQCHRERGKSERTCATERGNSVESSATARRGNSRKVSRTRCNSLSSAALSMRRDVIITA